jgi:type I restriction enzyme R subunit
LTPEDKAREQIDKMLVLAGWHVCDFKDANIHAARGVVIRNYPLNKAMVLPITSSILTEKLPV